LERGRVITVEEARTRLLALAAPLPSCDLPLSKCAGRFLTSDIAAKRTQPAADLSAMDGYALRFDDDGAPFTVIGESAAGQPFSGMLGSNEAVRIFTGAHVPIGADTVLIQEDAVVDGTALTPSEDGLLSKGKHIRQLGSDFHEGEMLLTAGQLLNPGAVALAAMGGYGALPVGTAPQISIIGSGSELAPPGEPLGEAQIPSSNNVMLAAMLTYLPCTIHDEGIVKDDLSALEAKITACAGSDIIVTSGGASVGDHDLVQAALINAGAEINFWRVAMRPGKPLMLGKLGNSIVLGLPGNPGSAFVTAFLFLLPLVRHLAGSNAPWPGLLSAPATQDLKAGGARAEYLRAVVSEEGIKPFQGQDSGVTGILSKANALLIRPINAAPFSAGAVVNYFAL
jgi:molybdopterin molybdotransferase